jgi:hypothetical protein
MLKTEIEGAVRDEVSDFEDLRSVGSSEAAWHIFNFAIARKYPAVQALRCHLEDEQQVVFDEGNEEEVIEKQRFTELTEYFSYNQEHPDTQVKYVDFPKEFTWASTEKKWKIRKGSFDTIGRVHAMHPAAGDVFYLRMLLHHDHCRGKASFDDLMTVDGSCLESYQEVCRVLGLLQDDKEWDQVLSDGSVTQMCPALRELFITILIFCMPANPRELFEKHYMDWTDDIQRQSTEKGHVLNDEQLRILILLDIQQRLQSWGRNLSMLRLPDPTEIEIKTVSLTQKRHPAIIREELDFDRVDLEQLVEERCSKLTASQKIVFDDVMDSVLKQETLALFIDARGGTGKTFVLNTILAAVRLIDEDIDGTVALATGTTGIASNLLLLGRTFHSRFKAPLTPTRDSVCSIDAQSSLASLIRMARIIVIDEAPMIIWKH